MDSAQITPLLECHGVSKRFGAIRALDGVDFELLPGEVHAFLGQNGAGKSTLIKVLAGVVRPDSGVIRVCGEIADFRGAADARAAGIAVVYQELSLVPSLSVEANLFLGQEPTRLGLIRRREIRRNAREFLARYGFPLHGGSLVQDLPFAYRQLVEIAKALISDASVLVLDEPTASLNSEEQEILFRAINELTSRGVGVIYVTHRLSEVFRIVQQITVLRNGANAGSFNTRDADMESLVTAIVGAADTDLAHTTAGVATEPPAPEAEASRASAVAEDGRLPVLELCGVSNDRLRDVDLALKPGEIVGLAGVIGSGRSEILETMFGLRRVKYGELRVYGKRRDFRSPLDAIRNGIALVPEDRRIQGVVIDHSIERNLALPSIPRLTRMGLFRRRASRTRAWDAIRALSIKAPGPGTAVLNLSGGNQQKVVFGKWLEPIPAVLLLDEPTVGLDVGAREEIYEIIRKLARDGVAVVVVSSELVELFLLCDRFVVVADGRIVEQMPRVEISSEEYLHHLVHDARSHLAEQATSDEESSNESLAGVRAEEPREH